MVAQSEAAFLSIAQGNARQVATVKILPRPSMPSIDTANSSRSSASSTVQTTGRIWI
jgi:hypothetical protein